MYTCYKSDMWRCLDLTAPLNGSLWRAKNGSNWSERDLNVLMALLAPQKVPLVLCVYYYHDYGPMFMRIMINLRLVSFCGQ